MPISQYSSHGIYASHKKDIVSRLTSEVLALPCVAQNKDFSKTDEGRERPKMAGECYIASDTWNQVRKESLPASLPLI